MSAAAWPVLAPLDVDELVARDFGWGEYHRHRLDAEGRTRVVERRRLHVEEAEEANAAAAYSGDAWRWFKAGEPVSGAICYACATWRSPWGRHYGRPCNREQLVALALTFPSLRGAPLLPWSAQRFARWARTSPAVTAGSRYAARFVLSVWSGRNGVHRGLDFDVVDALAHWDERHREAFRAWAAAPWWP